MTVVGLRFASAEAPMPERPAPSGPVPTGPGPDRSPEPMQPADPPIQPVIIDPPPPSERSFNSPQRNDIQQEQEQ